MNDKLIIVIGTGLAGAVCVLTIFALNVEIGEAPVSGGRRTKFSRELAENVSVSQHGLYGIDVISCKSARMEKRKYGPLTLGGMNVLVLDGLSVVLPPHAEAGVVESRKEEVPAGVQLARRLGVTEGFLRGSGMPLRFTGLKVTNLSVSTLDNATNAIWRFSAERGEAARDGLHLEGCRVRDAEGRTNEVGRAVLTHKPELRLTWSCGSVDL